MLFSIITVCFNSAKTIRQTFDSVLQQKCTDYEYIVVDGVSTDGTVDIIREYEPKFQGRIHWISEPDGGIYFAMNKGIRMAAGEYLNFLNADDYFTPDTLSILKSQIAADPNGDIYYGISRCFDSQGEICLIRQSHTRLPYCRINHQAMWHRRSIFDSFGMYDTRYRICADFHHQLGLFKKQYSFRPVDAVLVNYSNSGYSANQKNEDAMLDENARIYYEYGYFTYFKFKRKIYIRKIKNALFALLFFPYRSVHFIMSGKGR